MNIRLKQLHFLALLLVLGTVTAATHVNISIGHPATANSGNEQAPAELRAGSFAKKHHSDFAYHTEGRNRAIADRSGNYEYFQGHSARLTADNDAGRQQHEFDQQQSGYNARLKEQDRQNQEFERYIQNYHSGPTVETVFESSTPSSLSSTRQNHLSSSSSSPSSSSSNGGQFQRLVQIGSRPSQVHTFERQVALSTGAPTTTLLPPSDDRQTHSLTVDEGISSSSSSSSNGFDRSSFDSAKTNFNKPSFGYDDGDVQNQYPPSVDDSQRNFGSNSVSNDKSGFYGGNDQSTYFGGSTPAPGYLPSYPRPVVKKTIQIAQPALKAKKFEIRHPAVQKEFYDIEEHVVIKPAGTVVVELERPVAKIPKGETVLPLGHPHPAVASAYNTNGAAIVQTMDSDVHNGNNNNQYSPSPVYTPKAPEPQYSAHPNIASTVIGSTVTTTPSYDSSSKDEFVESNLNKQFGADAQYVTTTERDYADKQGNDGFFVTTEKPSGRNYGSQFYALDETDHRYPSGQAGVNTAYAPKTRQYNNFVAGSQLPQAPQYHPSFNDNSQFQDERFGYEFQSNQQDSKPARLQEQPRTYNRGLTTQIIKHEHNIHLPASQQNIYLGSSGQDSGLNGRLQQKPQFRSGSRYNEEAAEVLEIKPYLKHHTGSVIVYASSKNRPSTSSFNGHYTQRPYQDYARYSSPMEQYQQRQFYAVNNDVKYNAPYSNIRYFSNQTPRYVYGSEANYRDKSNYMTEGTKDNNNGYRTDYPANDGGASQHHAHIQIQIPHHHKEVSKPIVVTSTINPVVHNVDEDSSASLHASANRRDGDVDSFGGQGENHSANFEASTSQADCDKNPSQDDELFRNRGLSSSQKSLRLVDSGVVGDGLFSSAVSHNSGGSLQHGSVDVNLKSTAGHVNTVGSRVIAATPAPTDAAATSQSFHKRRIVVNHPFQTVREVVEHEPITNYHHIQVNEPASPELYQHTAPYYQQETHGALRHAELLPVVYHHHTAQTHGNFRYAPVFPVVHSVPVGYHHG